MILGRGRFDDALVGSHADGLAGLEDDEAVGVPVAIEQSGDQGGVAVLAVAGPAEELGALSCKLEVGVGDTDAEVDVGCAVVVFEPGLLLLHEELGIIGAVLTEVFLVELIVAFLSWGGAVAVPAGGVPVCSWITGYMLCIPFFASEEEGDAIVCAWDDEGAAGGSDALGAAAAEAVAEDDRLEVGDEFEAVDGVLEVASEVIGLVVEALLEDFDMDDVFEVSGEVLELDFKDSAGDDGGGEGRAECGRVGGGAGRGRWGIAGRLHHGYANPSRSPWALPIRVLDFFGRNGQNHRAWSCDSRSLHKQRMAW
jgi:hypothetical protein